MKTTFSYDVAKHYALALKINLWTAKNEALSRSQHCDLTMLCVSLKSDFLHSFLDYTTSHRLNSIMEIIRKDLP